MDKDEIIRRLKRLAKHSVHVVGELPYIMSIDDGIALDEAVRLLKEQDAEIREKNQRIWELLCERDSDDGR